MICLGSRKYSEKQCLKNCMNDEGNTGVASPRGRAGGGEGGAGGLRSRRWGWRRHWGGVGLARWEGERWTALGAVADECDGLAKTEAEVVFFVGTATYEVMHNLLM